jgi:hypothetical protein
MKTYSQLLMIIFLLIGRTASADIIPENSHYVTMCVKITNLEEYPEISLLGYVKSFGGSHFLTYEVLSSNCLSKGYKFYTLELYAVPKTYLIGKDTSELDLPNDKNAVITNIQINPYYGYINNSNPLISVEQYYKIVGFTESSVIIYKWQEINKYNNGQKDQVKTFDYTGDISILSQKITTGTSASKTNSGIELFPNPAQKNVHLKISNNYQGTVQIGVFTTDGKKVNSMYAAKESATLEYTIPISSLSKGTYLVYVGIGKKAEWKKLVVN